MILYIFYTTYWYRRLIESTGSGITKSGNNYAGVDLKVALDNQIKIIKQRMKALAEKTGVGKNDGDVITKDEKDFLEGMINSIIDYDPNTNDVEIEKIRNSIIKKIKKHFPQLIWQYTKNGNQTNSIIDFQGSSIHINDDFLNSIFTKKEIGHVDANRLSSTATQDNINDMFSQINALMTNQEKTDLLSKQSQQRVKSLWKSYNKLNKLMKKDYQNDTKIRANLIMQLNKARYLINGYQGIRNYINGAFFEQIVAAIPRAARTQAGAAIMNQLPSLTFKRQSLIATRVGNIPITIVGTIKTQKSGQDETKSRTVQGKTDIEIKVPLGKSNQKVFEMSAKNISYNSKDHADFNNSRIITLLSNSPLSSVLSDASSDLIYVLANAAATHYGAPKEGKDQSGPSRFNVSPEHSGIYLNGSDSAKFGELRNQVAQLFKNIAFYNALTGDTMGGQMNDGVANTLVLNKRIEDRHQVRIVSMADMMNQVLDNKLQQKKYITIETSSEGGSNKLLLSNTFVPASQGPGIDVLKAKKQAAEQRSATVLADFYATKITVKMHTGAFGI